MIYFEAYTYESCRWLTFLFYSQLFEVYDTLPDPSLGQMVEIVKGAVNLCSGIYICVGFFGYIAFYSVDFGGTIMKLKHIH